MLKQLSIFVENKFGRLGAILDVLKEHNIDISALSLADTTEFGILRLIVDKPDEAVAALKETGVMVKCTGVIAASMADKPGGLAQLLKILTDEDISIEYMYAFMAKTDESAWTVLKTDTPEKAIEAFNKNGVKMLEDGFRL